MFVRHGTPSHKILMYVVKIVKRVSQGSPLNTLEIFAFLPTASVICYLRFVPWHEYAYLDEFCIYASIGACASRYALRYGQVYNFMEHHVCICHSHTRAHHQASSNGKPHPGTCAKEEDWEGPEGTRLWGWAMQPVKEAAPSEDFPELQAGVGKRGVSSEAGRIFWVHFVFVELNAKQQLHLGPSKMIS